MRHVVHLTLTLKLSKFESPKTVFSSVSHFFDVFFTTDYFFSNSKSYKEASRMMLLLNSSEIEELITRLIIEKFDGKNRDLAKESL